MITITGARDLHLRRSCCQDHEPRADLVINPTKVRPRRHQGDKVQRRQEKTYRQTTQEPRASGMTTGRIGEPVAPRSLMQAPKKANS
jgi:hypothetical protein